MNIQSMFNPRNSLIYWWARQDLNLRPDDYESVLSCLYRLILTYTVCYCLYNIRLLKVKPVLLSDTEYQAEIRVIDTYMDTYYLWGSLTHMRTCECPKRCLYPQELDFIFPIISMNCGINIAND